MLDAGCLVSRIYEPASSMSQLAKTDANDWRKLYPFGSNWFDLPGGRMHYLDEGPLTPNNAAPTLLFVHGNPTWSFHWRRLIAALRPNYRCVAPDHLCCGLSDRLSKLLSLD